MEGLEFNVSHLLRQTIGAFRGERIDINECPALDEIRIRGIHGDVHLIRTNFGILARAKLRADVDLECDSCLDPYTAVVSAGFEEEYLPVIEVATGRPVQSERTDETFFISPNHIVDLTEASRQHVLLSIPMRRLCSERCLGLCQSCGANRNIRECSCGEQGDIALLPMAMLLKEATRPN